MSRQVNAAAVAICDSAEGCILSAYRDPVGVLTIGRGHTGPDVRAGMTITPAQAIALEQQDLQTAGNFVLSKVRVPLDDNQYSALAEFVFNVGRGNFAGSTLLRLLNAGNYAAVPAQLARWNKATVNGKPTVLPGLVTRRAHEAALFVAPVAATAVTSAWIASTPVAPARQPVQIAAPSLIERFRAWLHDIAAPVPVPSAP